MLKPDEIMNVPRGNDSGTQDVDLGTTEIHIDEQGNLRTLEEERRKAQERLQTAAPASSVPPVEPVNPVAKSEPEADKAQNNHHAFLGTTAQPYTADVPFSATTGQTDWAAPYEMVPLDPLGDKGATSSEFGSTPVSAPSEASPDNFSQVHTVQPPSEPTPVATPVDNARSAVETAIAGAPFDPAFSPPVQALNSQMLAEPSPAAPPNPAASASDTPSLQLPGMSPPPAAPPQPPPAADVASTAPPPMPPPLVAGPGAVVPNLPQQK
jgi:hypothetical protein